MIHVKTIGDGLIQIWSTNHAEIGRIARRLTKRDLYWGSFANSFFVRQYDFNKQAITKLIK